ncbi:hypothetical protein KC351_g9958 [Hortaea werneckii]|nr:hypothetical protein KC351_g9958 [Hortaea werneckii]
MGRLLEPLSLPVSEAFDFVCGTSAGGLIIIGIFLMKWSPHVCIEKFESLANKMFRSRKDGSSFLCRVQRLALSYLRDCQYSSSPIVDAFASSMDNDELMFNPLSSDTKVAVTTTSVRGSRPYLISNYNGERREGTKASSSDQDVSISQAATCTSAAPWYFKPRSLPHFGTFQDGGLHHNNPLSIAMWELKHLWAGCETPDFALSMGTGYAENLFARVGDVPQSPVQDRFLPRIFKTFMNSLDGERIWHDLHNSLPELAKDRFHRVNLKIKGLEPAIDDLNGMRDLKAQTQTFVNLEDPLKPTLDSIIASSFYFELDGMPQFVDGSFLCVGHIFCRLSLPVQGRRWIYTELMKTKSYFLVSGSPVSCVDRVSRNYPPFKRRLKFCVGSLDDTIRITLRGIVDPSRSISGLPKTAREIIKLQSLEAPFGRVDHRRADKPLPLVPRKRSRNEL